MELYIGNNFISDLKEVKHLRDLNKIIILDMSGNPLCNEETYRGFILFNLQKLKVLDGVSIDVNEQQIARELFTGRLTEEILESRLSGQLEKDIKVLDLSSCKLKDFDDMFTGSRFPSLRDLNLSGNLFTSLRCITNLPNLKILNLNNNRIDSLMLQNVNIVGSNKGLNALQVIIAKRLFLTNSIQLK